MRCPRCNSEMEDDSLFCPECGFQMQGNYGGGRGSRSAGDSYDDFGPGSNPYGPGPDSYGPGPNPYGPGPNPYGSGPNPYGPGPNPYRPGTNRDMPLNDPQKKNAALPVIIGLLAAAVCVGVIFGVKSGKFPNPFGRTQTESADASDKEDPMSGGDDSIEAEPAEETPEPEATEKALTAADIDAYLVNDTYENLIQQGYQEVYVVEAGASSVISQQGTSNDPILMFDRDKNTNWQEGVSGPGIGELIQANFSAPVKVKYILFRLGNWKTERYFYGNNKPSLITIQLNDFSKQIQFRDTWEEFCVELNHPYEASALNLRLDDVFKGTNWDDTCITDITILGDRAS